MKKYIEIRQIYYDQLTFDLVEEPFLGLNNSNGPKNWYEFWPILKFLHENKLEENKFYGFLSPKFKQKTGFDPLLTNETILSNFSKDVIIFGYAWEQSCFFLNPWEQGEFTNPKLQNETQKFIDSIGYKINLANSVLTRQNTVYSNFVIAKKSFWDEWKKIASMFLVYLKNNNKLDRMTTTYRKNQVLLRVFIQERFSSFLLKYGSFDTKLIDVLPEFRKPTALFINSFDNRMKLLEADYLKSEYLKNMQKFSLLNEFFKLRKSIKLNKRELERFLSRRNQWI